jgi:hypothetical protein
MSGTITESSANMFAAGRVNTDRFMADPKRYFSGSYELFEKFGGPCSYFHEKCLRAGGDKFLSERHIEMLYATLTAWGMHRMGKGMTKLTEWQKFSGSIRDQGREFKQFQSCSLLKMSETEYSNAVLQLKPYYQKLKLSASKATIVVNSKALHHLFPDFIPPIDRQYTVRFFKQKPEQWLYKKKKFRTVVLPPEPEEQFEWFHRICVGIKRLADRVDPALIEDEFHLHDVMAPKALDNAIVNYVSITAADVIEELEKLERKTIGPAQEMVTDDEVLNVWANREETADEIARQLRQGNHRHG